MRYITLLKQPRILLLWLGQLASTAGDRLYGMAVLWMTLEITGSTQQMAAVALVETAPYLVVGLVGGSLIDRLPRLRLMIGLDLLRAAVVLILPVIHLMGTLQPVHLALVALVLGSLNALFGPALDSSLPSMVPPDDLPALSGLIDTTTRFGRILGPGMAGLLLTLIPAVHFFTLDAISFLLSALFLAAVAARTAAAPHPAAQTRQRRPLWADLTVGWRIAFRDRRLLVPLLVSSLNNFAWAAFTLGAPLLAATRLDAAMGGYGLMIGAYGVGSLAGNALAGNAARRERLVLWQLGGWVGVGLGFALLGLAPTLPIALACTALAGVGGSMAHVARSAAIGSLTPAQHLGKLFSLQSMASNLSLGLGLAATGWLLELLPTSAVISGAGLFMGITAFTGLLAVRGQAPAPAPGHILEG